MLAALQREKRLEQRRGMWKNGVCSCASSEVAMRRLRWFALSSGIFGALVAVPTPPPARADFEKDVAPLLVKNCLGCHNASEARSGLDLTHREGLLKGGKGGPAVVPGSPDESRLIERV